jgi:hypothetical protein
MGTRKPAEPKYNGGSFRIFVFRIFGPQIPNSIMNAPMISIWNSKFHNSKFHNEDDLDTTNSLIKKIVMDIYFVVPFNLLHTAERKVGVVFFIILFVKNIPCSYVVWAIKKQTIY